MTRSAWWTFSRRWRLSPSPAPPRRAACCPPAAPHWRPGAPRYCGGLCSNLFSFCSIGCADVAAASSVAHAAYFPAGQNTQSHPAFRMSQESRSRMQHAFELPYALVCERNCRLLPRSGCSHQTMSQQQQQRQQTKHQRQRDVAVQQPNAAAGGFGGWPAPFGLPASPFQLPLPSPAAFLGAPAAALLFPPPLQVRDPCRFLVMDVFECQLPLPLLSPAAFPGRARSGGALPAATGINSC